MTISAGSFTKIYDPSVDLPKPWYINDHSFIQARDGRWHLFGITHVEPADPENEWVFAHATAGSLHGPWTHETTALVVDPVYGPGESHLWAPHVIEHQGVYYMFYAGGNADRSRSAISVATSPDLWTWTRLPSGPLFLDGYEARDPYVTRIGGTWVMYYTATSQPTGGHHTVMARTSQDLVQWGERRTVFTDPEVGTWGGGTESPYVVQYDGWWHLFIGPRGGYAGTDVFRSTDPFRFTAAGLCGRIESHAAEIVKDSRGWWVSHAGWGQGGVHLAPLRWS